MIRGKQTFENIFATGDGKGLLNGKHIFMKKDKLFQMFQLTLHHTFLWLYIINLWFEISNHIFWFKSHIKNWITLKVCLWTLFIIAHVHWYIQSVIWGTRFYGFTESLRSIFIWYIVKLGCNDHGYSKFMAMGN